MAIDSTYVSPNNLTQSLTFDEAREVMRQIGQVTIIPPGMIGNILFHRSSVEARIEGAGPDECFVYNRNTELSKQSVLHGLEYEFQLVTEYKGEMQTVHVCDMNAYGLQFVSGWNLDYAPRGSSCKAFGLDIHIKSDCGNIEISTEPFPTYVECVEDAERLLSKLVEYLSKHLNKFALFLPAQISDLRSRQLVCSKHWNYSCKDLRDWNIASDGLSRNGYEIQRKGRDNHSVAFEIKIPYWYTPSDNPLELPHFDSLRPPDKWKSLVGYYRNGKWIQVRKLC